MESYYLNNFEVKPRHSSEEALQKWRKLCGFVKNPKRRFRFTANPSKRYEAQAMRRTNQEKLRVAVLVSKAAFQFMQYTRPRDYAVPKEEVAGFGIFDEELGSIVENPSIDGLTTDSDLLDRRQENFSIHFRDALTAVLIVCALKGSLTRVNNLLSFLKGLSAEGACIPHPAWEWTPYAWGSPPCEREKIYLGYMIYFFMVN